MFSFSEFFSISNKVMNAFKSIFGTGLSIYFNTFLFSSIYYFALLIKSIEGYRVSNQKVFSYFAQIIQYSLEGLLQKFGAEAFISRIMSLDLWEFFWIGLIFALISEIIFQLSYIDRVPFFFLPSYLIFSLFFFYNMVSIFNIYSKITS